MPALPSKFSRDYEDLTHFLCETTYCHLEEVHINNMEEILSGEPRTINSHIFSVKLYEYRMCLQVRIGTDISIGIILMKGRNDKSLVWPFNMIVLFRLKNLSGGECRVKMFRCDKNGSKIKEAISKPKSEMNAAVGFSHFISKQCLRSEGFIRKNQILLECYLFPKDAKINKPAELPSIIK